MNKDELRELVESAATSAATAVAELMKRSDQTADVNAITTAVSGAVVKALGDLPTPESVRAQIEAEIEKREKAEEEAARAKKKMEDDEMEMKEKKKKMEDDMEMKAGKRAELLVMLHPLLGDDFVSRGKTDHELLVQAVGNEVKDASERSEDYLLAKVEGILQRRSDAAAGPGNAPADRNDGARLPERFVQSGGFSMARMAEANRRAQAQANRNGA